MSSSAEPPVFAAADGGAELTFAARGGRTVLAHSHVRAPLSLVRPFPLDGGGQLVQLITIGPGLCGGDRMRIRIVVERGARVVVTTPAATRVLGMDAGQRAEQRVELHVADGATLEYYPAVTIPFPDSAFAQTIDVNVESGARVGVLETWALGRTSRNEYLRFRTLLSRTSASVDGALVYADAIDLDPRRDRLDGAAVLAGRRYLSSGFWYGVDLHERLVPGPVDAGDLMTVVDHTRPGIAYLRALSSDVPALDSELRHATDRVAAAWGQPPVRLDRFRC
jgi:urease accessory protein